MVRGRKEQIEIMIELGDRILKEVEEQLFE